MSQSFALLNGDLPVTNGRVFQIVSAKDKLLQDLRLWVLERLGSDPDTPNFGSQLDSYIGSNIDQSMINQTQAEVIRLLQQYQTMQVSNMQRDTVQFQGTNTLDSSEVIASVNNVSVQAVNTILLVSVQLTTLDGTQLQLSIPLNNA